MKHIATLFLLILLIGCNNGSINTLESARGQWERAGLTDYDIVIKIKTGEYDYSGSNSVGSAGFCEAYASVQQGNYMVIKPETTCEEEVVQTVDQLFESIANIPPKSCGGNGCVCDGYYEPIIEYDATYGYPTSISWSHKKESSGSGVVECTLLGTGTYLDIYRIQLTPR